MYIRRSILSTLVLLSGLLTWTSACALEINRFLSGSWYNPEQDGHGFSVEVISSSVTVIYWYVYHPDGSPTFILAVGQNQGNRVVADAFYNSGMRFGVFDPSERQEVPWGTITLTFNDCDDATLEYASTLSHQGQPFGSGTIELKRLLSMDQMQCSDHPAAGIYEGMFWSDMQGAAFPGFALLSQDGQFAAYSDGGLTGFGSYAANGANFSANGQSVSTDPDAIFSATLSANGEISPEYRLFSFYNVSGADSGYGDLNAVPALYRRSISLAALAGSYDAFNPVTGFGGSATLQANGSVSGLDELGCHYNGNVTIPDQQFNLFKVTITISTCPGFNGVYQGLGTQIDWFTLDDGRGLRVLVSSGQFAFLLFLTR